MGEFRHCADLPVRCRRCQQATAFGIGRRVRHDLCGTGRRRAIRYAGAGSRGRSEHGSEVSAMSAQPYSVSMCPAGRSRFHCRSTRPSLTRADRRSASEMSVSRRSGFIAAAWRRCRRFANAAPSSRGRRLDHPPVVASARKLRAAHSSPPSQGRTFGHVHYLDDVRSCPACRWKRGRMSPCRAKSDTRLWTSSAVMRQS